MKSIYKYKKTQKLFGVIFLIAIIITLIIYPNIYAKVCKNGILLWANYVLPSIFPFLFLTTLLTKLNVASFISRKLSPLTQRLFKLDGICAYCFFMSVASGYPVGSRIICDLKQSDLITESEATKMSGLCSTSGPLFVIGSVGAGMLKNTQFGVIIFISHILSVLVCGICLRGYKCEKINSRQAPPTTQTDNILGESVYSATISVLLIGGFISLFYTLIAMLTNWYALLPFAMFFSLILSPFKANTNNAIAFTSGLIESTTGCALLAKSVNILTLSLSTFIITFGGISILCQQIYYLKKAKVKIKFFMLIKVLQALLSFFFCYGLLLIIM